MLKLKFLASVSEQAPYGKGMETIFDKSVRNTLQVDPSKITIQNPAWDPCLKKLVHQVAESLDVSPSLVRAELYKLLLYEEGGFFKKHRDTEKAKGMFSTLVVQFPSKFTGGSFVVSHGDECETLSLGAGGDVAYDCHLVFVTTLTASTRLKGGIRTSPGTHLLIMLLWTWQAIG
jgi:predicted 2-oxoglutarate/Fe(II)-dependent dioxygenase YbiX